MKDKVVSDLIKKEKRRQESQICLIPSENFMSEGVREALGSVLSNKYAEGYPGKRYYQGNKIIDEIEMLAIERGKKLFDVPYLNVQPYSGSPANAAVLMALMEPGDKICGMKLSAGGHLTHGHPKITFSGRYYKSIQYDVDKEGRIEYEKVKELVEAEKPKLIFVGTTAYPWKFDWKKFREIADLAGAWLVADISHIAGLCVTGEHESPNEYADVITSTTHKMIRGPRGAVIGVTRRGISSAKGFGIHDLEKRIDRAVFPGMQGGPHMASIAAMAVAFGECLQPEYKKYTKQVVKNAVALKKGILNGGAEIGKANIGGAEMERNDRGEGKMIRNGHDRSVLRRGEAMMRNGRGEKAMMRNGHDRSVLRIFGTENHMMMVDCGFEKGKEVAERLEEEGIIVNANTIPHDQAGPLRPSGIRIGTPAMTTKGWKEGDFEVVGKRIGEIIL